MTAFAGESQATNKYTYFSSKAKKDGYVHAALDCLQRQQQTRENMQKCGSNY